MPDETVVATLHAKHWPAAKSFSIPVQTGQEPFAVLAGFMAYDQGGDFKRVMRDVMAMDLPQAKPHLQAVKKAWRR